MKNCYIHIPFCNSICSYCDFCKVFYNEELVNRYLDCLENEINSIYNGEILETIYIGGGTPSSLNIKQLNRLFNILDKFNKCKTIEFTIECNFNSTDHEKLDLFKKRGINRLSFGIETINEKYYEFLNRKESPDEIRDIINYAKSIGLININVDLMYAFKDETLSDVETDLDFIKSLDIKHISTYSLIIEDNTKLGIKGIENISEDIDASMYETICKYLKDLGFDHYEISNFSKEGFYSKHNLCYWNNSTYYGFGVGASSYINNSRINNTRSITKYLNGDFFLNKEELTINDKIYYEVILSFRKSSGIDLVDFKKKYGKDLSDYYDYSNLVKEELLKINGNSLYISEDLWYLSNEIIVRVLEGEVVNG